MTTSFAVTPEPMSKCDPICDSESTKGPLYPSVEFGDKHCGILKEAIGELPDVGDEIDVKVKLKVMSVSQGPNKYDNRISCSLISAEGFGDMSKDNDEKSDPAPAESAKPESKAKK